VCDGIICYGGGRACVYVDEMIYGSISISSSKALIVLRDYAGEALESLLTDTMFSHNTSVSRQCVSHQPFYYLLYSAAARADTARIYSYEKSRAVGAERVLEPVNISIISVCQRKGRSLARSSLYELKSLSAPD
jgi:hypothetical protein